MSSFCPDRFARTPQVCGSRQGLSPGTPGSTSSAAFSPVVALVYSLGCEVLNSKKHASFPVMYPSRLATAGSISDIFYVYNYNV